MKEAIAFLGADPIIGKLARSLELEPIVPSTQLYESLLKSIISQQLSLKAAATIYGRFLDISDWKIPDPDYLFALDPATLRAAGLSGQKALYLKEVAKAAIEKDLLHRDFSKATDEEIIQTLTAIKGVGRWTAEMILIFTLGRPDVFSLWDLGIRQGMVRLLGLQETGKELEKRISEAASAWSPYRSTACRLLWKSVDIE